MDGDSWPLLLCLFLMILGGGYFAATETAMTAMNRVRMKTKADGGNKYARRALAVDAEYDRALTTILIGNNIMHIGAASLATLLSTRAFGPGSVPVTTVLITIVVFLCSETIPKCYAKIESDRMALKVAGSLSVLMAICRPVSYGFVWIGHKLASLFPGEKEPTYTEDELLGIIDTIEDEGVLEPETQELVKSAFGFGDATAGDVMIPFARVVSVGVYDAPEAVLDLLGRYRYSRYPVLDGDRVVGVLHAGQYLKNSLRGARERPGKHMLPIRAYPREAHIDDMFEEMSKTKRHMAVVADEQGLPLGIVTIEDIVEELVGEIFDEKDQPAATDKE